MLLLAYLVKSYTGLIRTFDVLVLLRAGPAKVLIFCLIGDAPISIAYWDVIFDTM